jgi:RNA polymerase sigma-70 factor (ECF subfamily)
LNSLLFGPYPIITLKTGFRRWFRPVLEPEWADWNRFEHCQSQQFDTAPENIQVNTKVNSAAQYESDVALVRKAQQGDADAFAALFYAHRPRVYSLCLRMTKNTAEAEDLTQDAFLQVFRKLSRFRGNAALSTWLYRLAVNTVLMHFRKKRLRQVSLDDPSNQDTPIAKREYGSVDERLTGSLHRIALARAIQELPAGYRTIFLLHEIKGYEHQEIARILRCSVGNSKSQLHRARLMMRELLGSAA